MGEHSLGVSRTTHGHCMYHGACKELVKHHSPVLTLDCCVLHLMSQDLLRIRIWYGCSLGSHWIAKKTVHSKMFVSTRSPPNPFQINSNMDTQMHQLTSMKFENISKSHCEA